MLKRYTDYSSKELAAVTDDEFEKLIDIECMIEGITPDSVAPIYIEVPDIPDPDVKVYTVDCGSIMFTDVMEANALVDVISKAETIVATDYDYSIGYNHRYIKEKAQVPVVETEKYYSKQSFDNFRDILRKAERIEENNKALKKQYEEERSGYSELREKVLGRYNEAIKERREYEAAKNVFERYLIISERDMEMAKKYFAATNYADYADEIINDLQGQQGDKNECID